MKLRKQSFGEDYWARDIDVFGGGINEKRKIKRQANKVRRRDDKNIQTEQLEDSKPSCVDGAFFGRPWT